MTQYYPCFALPVAAQCVALLGRRPLLRSFNARDASPDIRRKALATISPLSSFGDASACPEIFERIVRRKATDFVDVLWEVARQQQTVVQRKIADDALHDVVDQRCTVCGDCVVVGRGSGAADSMHNCC